MKTLSPGPGAYKLPTRIADTPAYAGVKKPAEFHHV